MKNFVLLLFLAFVTRYGATGNLTASGKYPFVGGAACPRDIPLGVRVSIAGRTYICNDRTHLRFNGRYDIFSTGTRKEMLQFGKVKTEVIILK